MAGRYFGIPFAATGDKTTTPDAVQPDGSVSYAEGFGFDYERPNTDPAYKPVPRDGMNGLFYDITEAVGIIQKQGVADWTSDAAPYQIQSIVRHLDVVWISQIGNNSSTPGLDANWKPIYVGDIGQNIIAFSVAGITNWSVPAILQSGARKAKVTVVGGGGGAAEGPAGERGGGGGAGGYSFSVVDLSGVASVSVTVGQGGTGGTGAGTPGTSGTASSFGAYLSATGGFFGGGVGGTAGGEGGNGSGGSVNSKGGWGSDASPGGSGDGGASFFGGGGRSDVGIGRNAAAHGSGGGGGRGNVGKGGNGAPGAVIIEW